jgi:acetylornithine aminotransferase
VWCAVLGHNHPRVNQALRDQLERVAHIGYRYSAEIVEQAAQAVLDTLPFLEGKCVFLSSGSEAVEFGVQIARRLSGRPLLLTLADAYLAAYGSASRKVRREWYAIDWTECAACPHTDECDPGCIHLAAIPWSQVGGLVLEPGSSGGLVRLPPRSLVATLANWVQAEGGLVVVDEVTTGLGRTGRWYGYQHYDLQPDVVALGKGLGNGYPVSAVAMRGEVADRLLAGGYHYAQSHQNDPLGCAVAVAVLAVLREEALVERSATTGASLLAALERIGEEHSQIVEVRGRGLMIGIELESDRDHSATALYRALLERGYLVGCKPAASLLRLYPPLTLEKEQGDRFVTSLAQVLRRSASLPSFSGPP